MMALNRIDANVRFTSPRLRLSYSDILPIGCGGDSVGYLMIRGSGQWQGLTMD